MCRADRLFHWMQRVRGWRLSTAAFLVEWREISERTLYREVADLQRPGVPIEGEAGVGCRFGAGFGLPPRLFSQDQTKALVAPVRLSQDRGLLMRCVVSR